LKVREKRKRVSPRSLPGSRQKGDTPMFTLAGRVKLQQAVEQGFAEVQKEFFGQFKQVIDALLVAKRDRCLAA